MMDIEFGKLQQTVPQPGLRPDQDGQLVVALVGQRQTGDLPIFVDLDVLREMESHASSNTHVELGGVMLGYQCTDQEGSPFVVVTDCLRAEHYEATKGSFKFTHETWSQITRDRAKFKPELEMVGWYHTHPGWSVFLSGMDLFICDHFFHRPLDVALVIDPCQNDRGWFFWQPLNEERSEDPALESELIDSQAGDGKAEIERAPQRSAGFFLITGRFRKNELDYFANLYNQSMNRDPRHTNSISGAPGTGFTMVNLTDQRRPLFELGLAMMMFAQFLLVALIGWRMTAPTQSWQVDPADTTLKERLTELENTQLNQVQRQAQQDVLQMIVSAKEGQPDFVEKYSALKTELQQASSNLTAQMAVTDQLRQAQLATTTELAENKRLNERLSGQLQTARQELSDARKRQELLTAQVKQNAPQLLDSKSAELAATQFQLPWWAAIASGLGVLALGTGVGFLLGRAPITNDSLKVDPQMEPPMSRK